MNYYMILEVTPMATEKDVKDAYRRLAKKFHPDVCDRPDAKERFEEVAEAYEILHDSQKRLQYDRYLNDLEMRKTKFYQESEQKEKYEQEFRQAQYEARKKAAEYSKSPLEEILFGIVDVAVDITYEVGKAVLVGQSKDIDLSLGQNIGIGLKGIFLTICIALTFTGVLAPITLPLGIWIYKTLFYQGKFIGLWCLIKNVIIVAFTIALAIIIIAVAMEGV